MLACPKLSLRSRERKLRFYSLKEVHQGNGISSWPSVKEITEVAPKLIAWNNKQHSSMMKSQDYDDYEITIFRQKLGQLRVCCMKGMDYRYGPQGRILLE